MLGEYKIIVTQNQHDCLLAEIVYDGSSYWTNGKDAEELWEMVADLILTLHDVPISRWSKFWHKVLRLK